MREKNATSSILNGVGPKAAEALRIISATTDNMKSKVYLNRILKKEKNNPKISDDKEKALEIVLEHHFGLKKGSNTKSTEDFLKKTDPHFIEGVQPNNKALSQKRRVLMDKELRPIKQKKPKL